MSIPGLHGEGELVGSDTTFIAALYKKASNELVGSDTTF